MSGLSSNTFCSDSLISVFLQLLTYFTTATDKITEIDMNTTTIENTTSIYLSTSSTNGRPTTTSSGTTEKYGDMEYDMTVAWLFLAFILVMINGCCVVGVVMR